jgi:hypothetical protein
MHLKIIRLLVLTGLTCLLAIFGRDLATIIFSEFFYDFSGRREDNAVLRVLFRAGGLTAGGLFGAVLAYYFTCRPTAIRLLVLMFVGALLIGAKCAPAVQHGRPSEARAWLSIIGAVTGAILGALAHFRLPRR